MHLDAADAFQSLTLPRNKISEVPRYEEGPHFAVF